MQFDETQHPRDNDGKFTDKGGGEAKRVFELADELGVPYDRNTSYQALKARVEEAQKRLQNQRKDDKINLTNKTFSDNNTAREYFKNSAKKWESILSDSEKNSIRGYTDQKSDMINTYLRTPKEAVYYKSFNKINVDRQIKDIDNAISKFALDEPITTYRGTNLIEFGKDIYGIDEMKKLVGQTKTLLGYSSTSTNRNVANDDFDGEMLIEYSIPKGIGSGAYLDYMSVMDLDMEKRESEFLLKRNAQIKITSVDEQRDGKIYVKAEVLNG